MLISRRDWYPGLMERTKRLLSTYMPHLDLVLEIADARAPQATRWPALDAMIGTIPRLLLLNKADVADPTATRRWLDYLRGDPAQPPAMAISAGGAAATSQESNRLRAAVRAEHRPGRRGAQKVAVVGVPNVGKSTVINLISGRRRAPAGAKPGLTRGKQWVVVEQDLWILDLPGVLPPSPRTAEDLARIALTGSLPEGAYDALDIAMEFVRMTIQRAGPKGLATILTIDPDGPLPPDADPLAWLSAFARRRGLLGVGAEPNLEQAAQALVSDFRRGRLGRITLEVPAEVLSTDDPV